LRYATRVNVAEGVDNLEDLAESYMVLGICVFADKRVEQVPRMPDDLLKLHIPERFK
jgi:hypothetical protein